MKFVNLSEGNIVGQTWDFGDGLYAEAFNPKHVYRDTGYFNVQLYLLDSLGCDTLYRYPDSIYVEQLPFPDFTFEITNPSCYPALVIFTGVSTGNVDAWSWNFGDHTEINHEQNPLHTYLYPDKFQVLLEATTALGCKSTVTNHNDLQVNGPFAEIVSPDSACILTPYWFKLNDVANIYKAQWLFSDGLAFTADSVQRSFEEFGWHAFNLWLRSDSLHTCDKVLVDSLNIPFLKAQFQLSDTLGCQPLEVTATNYSVGNALQYWGLNNNGYSNEVDSRFQLTRVGVNGVELVVENALGCRDSLTHYLEVYPLPKPNISTDTLICIQDTIQLSASGGITYFWEPPIGLGNAYDAKPMVHPTVPTTYRVTVTDTNHCSNKDSVFVAIQNIPVVGIRNRDTLLIIGESLWLEGSALYASNYRWTPADDLDCDGCLSPMARPKTPTTFYFTVTDDYGCFSITDSINIGVDIKFSLALPSAFTPNGDGINDIVFVKGWGIEKLISFQVYNKFGLMVFETHNLEMGWDGKYKSSPLSADTYYYKVEVRSFDGMNRSRSGEIYLLR